jgi:hypothetical protein
MVIFMQKYVLAGALALALVGCSSEEKSEPAPARAQAGATTSVKVATASVDKSEESLKHAAEELDNRIAARDIPGAWNLYSQRCQADMNNSLDSFKMMLDLHFEGRHPQIVDHTVRVQGSMGQVVTIDKDPNAPAHAMNPRTWTFIDGRWLFDNC